MFEDVNEEVVGVYFVDSKVSNQSMRLKNLGHFLKAREIKEGLYIFLGARNNRDGEEGIQFFDRIIKEKS